MLFNVLGIAQPQGSMKSFRAKSGIIITKSDNPRLKPWRQAVAAAAIEAGLKALDGPVAVDITFYLPRPKGHFGARGLKASAPAFPIVKPDADKVLRAVLDALTGVGYRDDSQVVHAVSGKRYCDEGQAPSTLIAVHPFQPQGDFS